MSDNNQYATKQDLEFMFEGLKFFMKEEIQNSETRLENKIKDSETTLRQEIKDSETTLRQEIKDSELQTGIWIEDLEHNILGSQNDKVSINSDQIQEHNITLIQHDKRIDRLENNMILA